jgi:hypothetical protein
LAAVMPLDASLVSLRAASSPNSGQSSRRVAETWALAGIAAALAVGVETSAGALDPQAVSSVQRDVVRPSATIRRVRTSPF